MVPSFTATVICLSLAKAVSAQVYRRPRRTVGSVIAGAIIGMRRRRASRIISGFNFCFAL